MSVLNCKMCGGDLAIEEQQGFATCEYCGSTMTIPKRTDEQQTNLYNRANHYRQNGDFDRAAKVYEKILDTDSTAAEAYWGLLLCRYGIEYVEDPKTHKRIPTCHRAQYQSILQDPDYQAAWEQATGYARTLYEQEAIQIDQIQKEILEISKKEEPFDVFLCYKESEENGNRTKDSVLAQEIYYELTEKGYKVFFSRITLENKLGTEYEPYIFAALHSARVLVVIGTRLEYFQAVWVKNEWNRYLALMQTDSKKLLIPAYRDLDPYDLPEEFSNLQALDMGKIGFMQDLIRGIEKVLQGTDGPRVQSGDSVDGTSSAPASSLLKRAYFFIEDGDFESAKAYFNSVLDRNPEESRAYWGLLLCENQCKTEEQLIRNGNSLLECSRNYQRAIQFAQDEEKQKYRGIEIAILQKNLEMCKKNEQQVIAQKNRIGELEQSLELIKKEIDRLTQERNEVETEKNTILHDLEERLESAKAKKRLLLEEFQELPFLAIRRKKEIQEEIARLYALIDETKAQYDKESIALRRQTKVRLIEMDRTIKAQIETEKEARQEIEQLRTVILNLRNDSSYKVCKASLQKAGKYTPVEGFLQEE